MKRLCLTLLLSLSLIARAQGETPEVLLFGVFHFANPGRDVMRTDQVDISTAANQTYLAGLALRLCEFRPTAILLEFDRVEEPEIRKQLDSYKAGKSGLTEVNEIQQIGFRVAKACGVDKLYGFDESEVGWNSGPLFRYLEKSAPDLLAAFNADIARLQAEAAKAHRGLGLKELLARSNDPEQDRLNKDLYLVTNAAGAGQGFEGADATASWWHRNFRMYANIQRYATPGARILVVAGNGHTAILRDLLGIDRRITARDIRPYF